MASRTTNHPVSNCAVQHLNSAVGVSFGRNPRGADRDCAMVMANIRRQHGLEPEPERARRHYIAQCVYKSRRHFRCSLYSVPHPHTHTHWWNMLISTRVCARVCESNAIYVYVLSYIHMQAIHFVSAPFMTPRLIRQCVTHECAECAWRTSPPR